MEVKTKGRKEEEEEEQEEGALRGDAQEGKVQRGKVKNTIPFSFVRLFFTGLRQRDNETHSGTATI